MALDGIFLRHLKKEIEDTAEGAKVEKIYQPNRDEIVIAFRGKNQNVKLLLSARANSPRIHFTQYSIENPPVPPMLCMLLRKKLTGAKLSQVTQPGLERVLCLHFDAINELGDRTVLRIYAEIMGRYSNIILTDEENKIIDAIHRVDTSMSSQRIVLPGIQYELPPAQDKISLLLVDAEPAAELILNKTSQTLSKSMLLTLQGVSPVICREIAQTATYGKDERIELLSENARIRFISQIRKLKELTENISGFPVIAKELKGKPLDFSFMEIHQYGINAITSSAESFSGLLDTFYAEKDSVERMRVRSHDLLRILLNASDRISRKLNLQKTELQMTGDREQKRIYGDLLNANLYKIEKGAVIADVENFYDNQNIIRIPLDPSLSPSQNAQKYYKEYRKAQTAEKVLIQQIKKGDEELEYINSVFDSLSRASSERELAEIKQELAEQGYLKLQRSSRKSPAALPPIAFQSTEDFLILVGRNNKQNDKLTLKDANKNDIWMHTKNIPGSHTIIVSNGKEVPSATMEQAALLAAYHSKAKESAMVAVDYTTVKNVKKPQGLKPGMVIYENYKTIYVTPDQTIIEKLKNKRENEK